MATWAPPADALIQRIIAHPQLAPVAGLAEPKSKYFPSAQEMQHKYMQCRDPLISLSMKQVFNRAIIKLAERVLASKDFVQS